MSVPRLIPNAGGSQLLFLDGSWLCWLRWWLLFCYSRSKGKRVFDLEGPVLQPSRKLQTPESESPNSQFSAIETLLMKVKACLPWERASLRGCRCLNMRALVVRAGREPRESKPSLRYAVAFNSPVVTILIHQPWA